MVTRQITAHEGQHNSKTLVVIHSDLMYRFDIGIKHTTQ